jgi:hypothetical protein
MRARSVVVADLDAELEEGRGGSSNAHSELVHWWIVLRISRSTEDLLISNFNTKTRGRPRHHWRAVARSNTIVSRQRGHNR